MGPILRPASSLSNSISALVSRSSMALAPRARIARIPLVLLQSVALLSSKNLTSLNGSQRFQPFAHRQSRLVVQQPVQDIAIALTLVLCSLEPLCDLIPNRKCGVRHALKMHYTLV